MDMGQFHCRSYSFSLNQPLMKLISKSFSHGHNYKILLSDANHTGW
jgi:hypothetical protein